MDRPTLIDQRKSYIVAKQLQNARELEVAYLAEHPNDASVHVNASWTAASLRLFDEALSHLWRAVALEPKNIAHRAMLTKTLEQAAKHTRNEATAIFNEQLGLVREKQRVTVANALKAVIPKWNYRTSDNTELRFPDIYEAFPSDAAVHWVIQLPQIIALGKTVDLTPVGKFYVGDTKQIIHKRFCRGIPWELPIAALIMELASRCDRSATLLDIGANIGAITIPMGRTHTGSVIAVEPNPRNFRDLQSNIELNGLTNVKSLQVAVSDAPGKATMSAPDNNPTNMHIDSVGDGDVVVARLDDIVDQPVALIKMDIEGHELNAIKGATRILQNDRPIILCELLSGSPTVKAELERRGYTGHHLAEADWMFIPADAENS